LADPDLYSIGLNKDCFSFKLLFKYIVYALWHAFIVFMACFFSLNMIGVTRNDGKDIGLWVGGMTVFGCSIFIANFVLGLHSKTYEWRYIVLLCLGPIAYFLFYWILNIIFVGDIAYLFGANFSIIAVWFAIMFSMVSTYILDIVKDSIENFEHIEKDVIFA